MNRRLADWLRIVLSVVLVTAFAFAAWRMGMFDPGEAQALRREAGQQYLLPAFVALYALVTALALPGSPLAYGAGAVFGFARGAVIVWTASMIGAAIGYALARGVLSGPARRLVGSHSHQQYASVPRIASWRKHPGMLQDLRNERKVALTALRLQLLPFIPFGVINYGAGIGKVPILPFMVATALGIVPGTLVETFVGDRLSSGVRGDRTALALGIAIPLAIFGLSLLPKLVKKTRR